MRTLHDPATRAGLIARIQGLRPDSARRWGSMTVDQMVWHVNQGLLNGLGETEIPPTPMPVPGFLVKPLVLHLPWPKGAPTAPAFEARGRHDFGEQKQELLRLVDVFAAADLGGTWPRHTGFGRLSGREWSRLMYRHLDHHLRQFSA